MIKLSRSKLKLFFDCHRCFWFYAAKSIARPFGAPYTINNAVDFLFTHTKYGLGKHIGILET